MKVSVCNIVYEWIKLFERFPIDDNLHAIEYMLNKFQSNYGATLLHELLPSGLPMEYQRSVSDISRFGDKLLKYLYMQVDSFSIQTRSHPLFITTHGFFPLDNTLLFSVRANIFVAYMRQFSYFLFSYLSCSYHNRPSYYFIHQFRLL